MVNNTIRILLADDHPLMLKGVKMLLDQDPNMKVVGEVENGNDVLKLCRKLKPNVVLLDLTMDGPPPYEITGSLRQYLPMTKILIFSALEDTPHLSLLLNDVEGYVVKSDPPQNICEAIYRVVQGNTWFSQVVIQNLVLRHRKFVQSAPKPSFTDREAEVLNLTVGGNTNKQISLKLNISERTVQFHLRNVYDKLGVNSRSAAIACAVRLDEREPENSPLIS